MKKWLIIFVFTLGFFEKGTAQEMWGAASSNFAGQMGTDLNPASIVGAPYKWEIHLLSADASLTNNYMYLKRNSKIFRNTEAADEDRFGDRYTKTDKYAYASAFVKYPGFIWVGKKFSLGFHASTRVELSATGVPYHLAKFIKEGFDYSAQQNVDYSANKTDAALINWHELAFTGGAVLLNTPETFITGAATLKYNYGLNAYYLNISNMSYNIRSDSTLDIYNIDAEYGHAMPVNGDGGINDVLQKRGHGASVDLGIQYYRNRNDQYYEPCNTKRLKPYDYKVGVSLIDLGYLTYNRDARTFMYDNLNTNWTDFDTSDFNGIGTIDTTFGNQFFGRPNGARDQFSFRVFTPAALSVQLDVPVIPRFFVSATAIQRIAFSRQEIKRSNQLSITPRFETRAFEFSLPFSVYDFFRPRLGVAMRIKYLTIGTDMLGPLVGITNAYGANIYFGITIKNFGSCNSGERSKMRKPKIEECNVPGE